MDSKLIILLIALLSAVAAQNFEYSSYGRYFRFMMLDNFVERPLGRSLDLYVCNKAGQPSANVQIGIPYWRHDNCNNVTLNIAGGECQHASLCAELRHTYADSNLAKKVIELTSSQDVAVQGFNVEKFSADSFTIFPWESSGLTHFVMTYVLQHIQTQFGMVARETTTVRITVPNRVNETITIDYMGLRYHNGEVITFTLNPGHSFLAQSSGDLTGTLIQTNRPVAVFTGNVRTYNDYNRGSRDHLIEQAPSTVKWGQEFVYVPTPRANPGDYVRIMARFRDTRVEFVTDETNVRTIRQGGDFIQLELDTVTHIKANKPVLVAIIVKSQEGKEVATTDPADPSMYFLPSVNQYTNEFYLPSFRDRDQVPYPKVALIVAVQSGSSFTVDGQSPSGSSLTRPSGSGSLGYSAGVVMVDGSRTHTVRSSQNMMVIGYGARDRESFGSSLAFVFRPSCEETVMVSRDELDNDCDGLVDEEICGNGIDDDGDRLVDEDCTGGADATGRVFAVVFMTNIVADTNVAIDQTELYISPLEEGTIVNVTAPGYTGPNPPNENRAAPLGDVLKIEIPPAMRMGNDPEDLGRSSRAFKAIKVESNNNIVLYGINKKQFSTDGFLAYPTAVTGTDYYAYSNFPINLNDDRCQFAVVAVVDNTVITIEFPPGVGAYGVGGSARLPAGGRTTYNLSAWEVLEIQSDDDLTGTHVFATDPDKRFSFFSGNVRTRLPLSRGSRDHLVEQLPPSDTWGFGFSSVATPRVEQIGDVFKVISSEINTRVSYSIYDDDRNVVTKNEVLEGHGSFITIAEGPSNIYIEGDKPILVIQISQSATERDTDPASIVVPPELQWSNNYRFVTPSSGQFTDDNIAKPFNNSIIVVVKSSERAGMIYERPDGTSYNLGTDEGWSPIPNTENEGILFPIPHGQSFLTHTDPEATYMALIFGREDRETYGNAIGLRLSRDNTLECVPSEQVEGDNRDNDCDDKVDEETCGDDIDNDGDGLVDEDCARHPSGFLYYVAFQENMVEFPRNYPLEIYVSNPSTEDTRCRLCTPDVTIHYSPFYDVTIDIPAGEVKEFALSSFLRLSGTRLMWNAISVECDGAVVVMGVNKETYSNDAFLSFEVQKLGKVYYTVSFSPATYCTQFAVVAFEAGVTEVRMDFNAIVTYKGINYDRLGLNMLKHEIFQAQSDVRGGDLTGSKVLADQRVAVFSGNVRTRVVLSASRDHLATQIPPIESWGTEFVLAAIHFRTVGDVIRVVASEPSTTVSFQGRTYNLPQPGSYVQFDLPSNSTGGLLTTNNRKVLVVQIMKSQAAPRIAEAADPAMILVSPTSQYVTRSGLVTPLYTQGSYKSGFDYNNWLTVIIRRGQETGIRINGERPGISGNVFNVVSTRSIPGTDYVAYDIHLMMGGLNSYVITHTSNSAFSGYMVGIADRESYAIGVGYNLPDVDNA